MLMRLGLLSSLSEEQVARLQPSFRPQWVARGENVFTQGKKCEHLRLVQEGSVRLEIERDGGAHLIDVVRAGQMMGEAGVFVGAPYPCSGVAGEDSLLISIHQQELERLCDSVPGLGWQLLRVFAARLLANQVRIGALAGLDARARVASVLLSFAQETLAEPPPPAPGAKAKPGAIEVKVSQQEIGQMAGVGRETVSRLLATWRAAGWVQVGRGRLVLLDVQALQSSFESGNAIRFPSQKT